MSNYKRGDYSPSSKLTESNVKLARKQYAQAQKIAERYSTRALAEKYGVSQGAMRRAITGENWGHVK